MTFRWWFVPLGLLAGYLASGLSVVQQDEVGVVRRFGAVLPEPWEPGLHWGLPWGIDRIDRLKPGQTRTLIVGGRGARSVPLAQAPGAASDDRLTGDLNLVAIEAILQYRVSEPVPYLFTSASVDRTLEAAAQASLTRALVERSIDDVLTSGRAEVAERILRSVQEQADLEKLGVSIRAVRLGRVAPPVPVAPAFADAARARNDLRQAVTRAEEYAERARADTEGQIQEIADRASAQVNRLIQVAHGEADRFTQVWNESRKALPATRRRLYLETLSFLLPRLQRKLIIAPGQTVDINLFTDDNQADQGTFPSPDTTNQ